MSLVKDLVDLASQLKESITDRKTRELFLPLEEMVLEVKREHFQIEQAHAKTVADRDRKYAVLDELHHKSQLESLVLRHSFYWDVNFNPHCPSCKTPLTRIDNPNFGHCTKCKTTLEFRNDTGEVSWSEMQAFVRDESNR